MQVRPWDGTGPTGKRYKADILLFDYNGPLEHYCESEKPRGSKVHTPCAETANRYSPHVFRSAVRSLPDNWGGFEAIDSEDGSPSKCVCGGRIRIRAGVPIDG